MKRTFLGGAVAAVLTLSGVAAHAGCADPRTVAPVEFAVGEIRPLIHRTSRRPQRAVRYVAMRADSAAFASMHSRTDNATTDWRDRT
jgi:hypothetical protein